jgi:hypothetical protein
MIDIAAIRARTRRPIPIPIPAAIAQGEEGWLREWKQDREDLRAALDELEQWRARYPGPYR